MAGVKGRSGRKTSLYERDTVGRLVEQSLRMTYLYISDPDIPLANKIDVASRFALKYMPEKIEAKVLTCDVSTDLIQRLIALASMMGYGNVDQLCTATRNVLPSNTPKPEIPAQDTSIDTPTIDSTTT